MCYTYDAQSRVTKRKVINLANNTSKDEVFAYDGAGNITYSMEDYEGSNFIYDTNNRLTCVCGIRNECMYAMIPTKDGFKPKNNNPFSWVTLLSEFKEKVQNQGVWDLKQQEKWQQSSLYYFNGELVDSDAPGNIMYGYMGKAYGIPDAILYMAAGYAQYKAGTTKKEWISNGFGDDPIDSNNIKRGIDYYNMLHS